MRRCWSAWACSAALIGVAGCGAARPAPPVVPADWQANARQVVQQLRVDIATAAVGGTTSDAAAKALRNTSDLYALLVAYSDLGGCRQMVRSAAAACAGRARHRAEPAAIWSGHPPCSPGRRSAPTRRRSSRRRTRSASPSLRSSARCWRFATAEFRLSRRDLRGLWQREPRREALLRRLRRAARRGLPLVRRREPTRQAVLR